MKYMLHLDGLTGEKTGEDIAAHLIRLGATQVLPTPKIRTKREIHFEGVDPDIVLSSVQSKGYSATISLYSNQGDL